VLLFIIILIRKISLNLIACAKKKANNKYRSNVKKNAHERNNIFHDGEKKIRAQKGAKHNASYKNEKIKGPLWWLVVVVICASELIELGYLVVLTMLIASNCFFVFPPAAMVTSGSKICVAETNLVALSKKPLRLLKLVPNKLLFLTFFAYFSDRHCRCEV
jgi:hypothetical protein